jgi:hypothetical protein
MKQNWPETIVGEEQFFNRKGEGLINDCGTAVYRCFFIPSRSVEEENNYGNGNVLHINV